MTTKSPTELSLSMLRASGHYCEVTEHFKKPPGMSSGYRKDMLGFVDILALKRNITLAVQTTSIGNISARVHKIAGLITFEWAKRAGWMIHVHGWDLEARHGEVRVIDMTTMTTLWTEIVRNGGKRKNTPRVQTALEL